MPRRLVASATALALVVVAAGHASGPVRPTYVSVSATVRKPAPPQDPALGVRDAIQRALVLQAVALNAGDLTAFLAPVAPADTALRAELTRRFESLRALQVTDWTPTVMGSPSLSNGVWHASVMIRYCVVVPGCRGVLSGTRTRWAEAGDRTYLVEFGATIAEDNGPRPWEVSALRTSVGARTVIVSSGRFAAQLPALQAQAEQAARFVDRFAKWSDPPGRYVVYVATAEEWQTWHGGGLEPWAAAYAVSLGNTSREVVVNGQYVRGGDLGAIFRHEFAHVVTLDGVVRHRQQTWWLVEGVAEYATVTGGSRALENIPTIRRYIRSGRWSGAVTLDPPPSGTSEADVQGLYGIAYLTVRRLVDRFGEARMFGFFEAVVRQARPPAEAAPTNLGTSWEEVAADLARYVRSR
jgi:hypothetical protein